MYINFEKASTNTHTHTVEPSHWQHFPRIYPINLHRAKSRNWSLQHLGLLLFADAIDWIPLRHEYSDQNQQASRQQVENFNEVVIK